MEEKKSENESLRSGVVITERSFCWNEIKIFKVAAIMSHRRFNLRINYFTNKTRM